MISSGSSSTDSGETVLAVQSNFEGNLSGKDVTIRGQFKGELKATGSVRILEGASVNGEINAERVEIGGQFQGNVSSKTLRLIGNARATGTFRAELLSVDEGAQLDGEFEVGSSAVTPAKARRESSL
jgi:cytoskeletal protein CcmA (bactofilin family)